MLATFLRDVSADIAVADLLLTSLIAQNPQFVSWQYSLPSLRSLYDRSRLDFLNVPAKHFSAAGQSRARCA